MLLLIIQNIAFFFGTILKTFKNMKETWGLKSPYEIQLGDNIRSLQSYFKFEQYN